MAEYGEDDQDLTPDEEALLRFQFEHATDFRAAQLGVDMDLFQEANPAGKHLIESAIDRLQEACMNLIETPLNTPEALDLQVEARANKRLVELVREALEIGRMATANLIEEDTAEESHHGEENP